MLSKQDIWFRDTICSSREELHEWLKYFIEIDLPNCIVDVEHSNCSPFEMVWKVYDSALRSQELTNGLFIGGRNSKKTLGASVVEFLLLMHDHRSVCHIGAIEKQADRAYQYFQKFFRYEAFAGFIDKMVMKQTVVKGKGTFEILPCTLASVNGPHTPFVCRDEIDTVQNMQAYKDIAGIPSQMPDGRPAIEIGISSRKSGHGLVQQEVDNTGKTGMEVYKWGILEDTQRCPDERSGIKNTPVYIILTSENMDAISEDEWTSLPDKTKAKFQRYEMREKCLQNCNHQFVAACRGFLKNQTSDSKYLRTIRSAEKDISKVSSEWAISQGLSIKPSAAGLIFEKFQQHRSVKSYKEMLELFFRTKIPNDVKIGLKEFIYEVESRGYRSVWGVDFGFTNPTCVECCYINKYDDIFFVREFAVTRWDGAEVAHYLRLNWLYEYEDDMTDLTELERESKKGKILHRLEICYPDIEDPGNIKLLKKSNITCAGVKRENKDQTTKKVVNKDVKGGIETVRKWLKVPGKNETKLYVHSSCKLAIEEFGKYHYKTDKFGNVISDEPVDENNHAMSAIRYIVHSRFGSVEGRFTDLDSGQDSAFVGEKNRASAPTASEMAMQIGLSGFNDNEEEYEGLKRQAEEENRRRQAQTAIETDEEFTDDDDDTDGFSFVF